MPILTLLSSLFKPFVVTKKILPLYFWLGGQSIFQGYWHNWCNQVIHFAGESATAPCMTLRDVPHYYNVVAVAYMNSTSVGDIPTFTISPEMEETGMTQEEFAEQVIELNTRVHKTAVILSLGGPKSNISLKSRQKNGLKDEFIRLAETYGFNGVDVNLERSVLDAANNTYVITTALKEAKYHFAHNQYYILGRLKYSPTQNFIITMSAQVTFRCDENYLPYLEGLEDKVEYITTKFFDYDDEDKIWMSYVFEALKDNPETHPIAMLMLHSKTYDLMKVCYEIPNHKLVHGTSVNALAGFQHKDNNIRMMQMFDRLTIQENPMRGVTGWSINWDNAIYSNGTQIDNAFAKLLGPWIRGFDDLKQNYSSPVLNSAS